MPALSTAEVTDAAAISALVNQAFRPERFFIDADRTNPDKIRALFARGQFLVLTEEDETIVGCVYIEIRGQRGYFGLLAVDPSRQGRGLGARLIAAAEEHCKAAGCEFMDLTIVNLRTELPAFYQRFGYSATGTLPFPQDQHPPRIPVHLVQMSKVL